MLILSQYIAPAQSIASIRWTKLAKYLNRSGAYDLTVLTNQKDYDGKGGNAFHKDPMLEADMEAFTQYHVFPDGKLLRYYYMLKYHCSDYVRENSAAPHISGYKRILYELMHDCKDLLQFSEARSYLKSHPALQECDVVVSSYDPSWTHLLAKWLKYRHPQLIWVADYRDLLCTDDTPAAIRHHRLSFTKKHTAQADLITVVSKEMIPALHLPQGQQVLVLPNGFDPEEALLPMKPDHFTLLYTGTLHAEGVRRRDLKPLFHIIQELIDEGEIEQKDLVLQYAGREGCLFAEQANACKLGNNVDDQGLVGREDAAKLRQQSAALLLSTWNTRREQGVLTGKLFEYMQSQKPILAVCTGEVPYCLVSEILLNGKLGFCLETSREETQKAFRDYLLKIYREWKRTGSIKFNPEEAYIKNYTHPMIAECLNRAINNIHTVEGGE